MNIPHPETLRKQTEQNQSFDYLPSNKDLKRHQILSIVKKMQESTQAGQYWTHYWFPKELLDNKKVLKSVVKFFRKANYEVDYNIDDRESLEHLVIGWTGNKEEES